MKIPETPQEWVRWLASLAKTEPGAVKLQEMTSKRFGGLSPRHILFVLCVRQLATSFQRPPTAKEITRMAEMEMSTHARNKLVSGGWLYASAVRHDSWPTYSIVPEKMKIVEAGIEKLWRLIEISKPGHHARKLLSE